MHVDPRDAALLAACPCLTMPRFGALPEMPMGQRIVVARNGIFVQVRLPWLNCIVRIASLPSAPPLPYGEATERIEFAFGVIPVALLCEFIEHGRAGLPCEVAGGLIYRSSTNTLRLQVYEAIEAGPGGIQYRLPELAGDELIAVDLHTHGRLGAFWSRTDDADDQGTKVSGVFGNLHLAEPTAKFRLVINGHFKDLPHPWSATAAQPCERVDSLDACPTLNALGFTEANAWNT